MSQEIENKINEALKEIRPFLNSDGGDIELVGVDGQIAKVRLLGNCLDCSVNQMTLKIGVEATIKKHVKEITQVVHVKKNELFL